MKLTFKKHKETGLAAIAAGVYTEIKHKRKMIGIISGDTIMRPDITIQIAFKKGNSWELAFLNRKFKTEEEAKKFIQENIEKISQTYELHYFEG